MRANRMKRWPALFWLCMSPFVLVGFVGGAIWFCLVSGYDWSLAFFAWSYQDGGKK